MSNKERLVRLAVELGWFSTLDGVNDFDLTRTCQVVLAEIGRQELPKPAAPVHSQWCIQQQQANTNLAGSQLGQGCTSGMAMMVCPACQAAK